jgi:hypothetical protein
MKTFEALGSIIKEENLISITDKALQNTLVLDLQDPFPGYHHDLPTESIPKSLFLVTNQLYNREQVTRARKNILLYSDFDFNAASSEIFIHNDVLFGIRIKALNSYDQIDQLQKDFINEGFSFRKFENINTKAIIKVKKTFLLEELESDIFADQLENYQGYFQIPKTLSWKLFEKITHSVRNNWEGKHFDAALGFFYKNFDIYEVVRIFHQREDQSILKELQTLYLKEMAKY